MAPTALTLVGIDGSRARAGGVAGGSAGRVVIEGLNESAGDGVRRLVTIDADADGKTLAEIAADSGKVHCSLPLWNRYEG